MWGVRITQHLLCNPLIIPSSSSLAVIPPSRRRRTSSLVVRSSSFEEEEEEEEQVIGDCLVFEDGVFEEDPFVSTSSSSSSSSSLVPQEWSHVVEEINLSKPQRRRLAQVAQFGQRILNTTKSNSLNPDQYLRFKNYKLSQLKPVTLDNPTTQQPPSSSSRVVPSSSSSSSSRPVPSSSSSRAPPQNPRWAVYGRGLDDITDFFNSPTYHPSHDVNSQGRLKLFTHQEKLLMNARFPKLAIATSFKWLPLHTLTASGEFYLVNALFKFQLDINAPDHHGLTALHKAIICKKQAITNYLLRESANPFVLDKHGATLMHYAVQTASSQAIKTLVLHNVDINLQDNDGWTPLHLAVQARRTDVVRLLLIKGADKTLKNKDGLSPLELCLHFGRDSKTYELIKLLKQLPRQGR
ncbi:hypothetical protein RND81_11G238500 [Saponaria officinalis]|uniref:Ankyrin repeat domain-containing protein, chloroplastic n=1 Tax=Saponaria officinalis TaxID=3572 RepID=A0AAW1HQY5_SAPOF